MRAAPALIPDRVIPSPGTVARTQSGGKAPAA
jgi:hypothetical protein